MRSTTSTWASSLAVLALLACHAKPLNPPLITAEQVDTTFVTREHMLAAVEMQLSGEPLATAMGRNLADYNRALLPTDLYVDGNTTAIDLPGFSSAVESYEYSKQPMNGLSFEFGAGLSLAYGPVLNPSGASGSAACALLRKRVQELGGLSNATSRFISTTVTDTNDLGWPGIWPTMIPFVSFDPRSAPTNSISENCSITSDDNTVGSSKSDPLISDDYECDATTLRLPNRAAQVVSAISPGASGWAGWKSALWVLNYLQIMHDSRENAVYTVPSGELDQVGITSNNILGDGQGGPTVPGTFLGSSDIEGFQAGMMLTGLDNAALLWLTSLTTSDGASLGGFPSVAAALAYNTASPPTWFPAQITVSETTDNGCEFPRPNGFTISESSSQLLDVAGMLGAYSSLYALTDQNNVDVGGSQPALAYFRGDPFPADDQLPDGEPTLHDRSLAMMRISLVNLLAMHVDPNSGLPVDAVTLVDGQPTRATTLSAENAAYTLLALRTARRSLTSVLELYSNNTPDSATLTTPLDAMPISASPPTVVTDELNTLITVLAELFYNQLSDDTGHAWLSWDVVHNVPSVSDDSIDAHSAAIRGLLVAYLSTGNVKYRERARTVFDRVETLFYDPLARLYRPSPGDRSATVTYNPVRFALLSAMLRDSLEVIAPSTGDPGFLSLLETRIARLNKLVLNGWDDRNNNQVVDYPEECVQFFHGVPGGGLQMAERTLSGDSGSAPGYAINVEKDDYHVKQTRQIAVDREHDCVPEISAAKLPSALANSITFRISGP